MYKVDFGNSGYERRSRNYGYDSHKYSYNGKNFSYGSNSNAKKRNSAKLGQTKKGLRCITAWNYSRGKGLLTFVAVPSKKYTKQYSSKTGNKFTLFAVKMVSKRSFTERTFFALYNETTGKLIMDKIGMVADTRNHYCVTIKH